MEFIVKNDMIYIKVKKSTIVMVAEVYLKDIAEVYGLNASIVAKIKMIKLHTFHEKQHNCYCIGILDIIKAIEQVEAATKIQCLGEVDCVVYKEHKSSRLSTKLKVIFVSCVSFFGTAFTIMAFHNDIGIVSVFDQIQRIILGNNGASFHILEVSYSIGLGAGMIIFFDHIGKKRIQKQPTPIEVSMCTYQNDVDLTIVDSFSRQGEEYSK